MDWISLNYIQFYSLNPGNLVTFSPITWQTGRWEQVADWDMQLPADSARGRQGRDWCKRWRWLPHYDCPMDRYHPANVCVQSHVTADLKAFSPTTISVNINISFILLWYLQLTDALDIFKLDFVFGSFLWSMIWYKILTFTISVSCSLLWLDSKGWWLGKWEDDGQYQSILNKPPTSLSHWATRHTSPIIDLFHLFNVDDTYLIRQFICTKPNKMIQFDFKPS